MNHNQTRSAGRSAYSGLHVLDLTGPSGSYAAKLFAELGAEVLKVEPPGGDPGRWLPPFDGDPHPDRSLHWWFHNTSKRSIILDLATSAGRDHFRQLARTADVIFDTQQADTLDTAGIGFEALRRENPGLIWASLTPFGLTGPRRAWKATDLTTSAIGGLMYLGGMPDRPPNWLGGEQSYLLGAVAMAAGAATALVARDVTGRGQRVDVSLQEATAVATENAIGFWNFLTTNRKRNGPYSFGRATLLGRATDGWVIGHIGGR